MKHRELLSKANVVALNFTLARGHGLESWYEDIAQEIVIIVLRNKPELVTWRYLTYAAREAYSVIFGDLRYGRGKPKIFVPVSNDDQIYIPLPEPELSFMIMRLRERWGCLPDKQRKALCDFAQDEMKAGARGRELNKVLAKINDMSIPANPSGRKAKVRLTCAECKGTFEVLPSKAKSRTCCCRACYGKYRSRMMQRDNPDSGNWNNNKVLRQQRENDRKLGDQIDHFMRANNEIPEQAIQETPR